MDLVVRQESGFWKWWKGCGLSGMELRAFLFLPLWNFECQLWVMPACKLRWVTEHGHLQQATHLCVGYELRKWGAQILSQTATTTTHCLIPSSTQAREPQ